MPTYTINGKRIKTDRELSEQEIEEIAAEVGGKPAVTGPEAIPTGGYPQAPEAQPQMSVTERMFRNALMGAAAVPPLAAGARALQVLTQGSKAAPYTTRLAEAVVPKTGQQLLAEGVIGAGAGIVGGEAGQQVAQKFGEKYRPLGEFAGGFAGGTGMNLAARTVPELFTMVRPGAAAQAAGVADLVGGVRAQTKLQQAMQANPQLAGDLARAQEIEQLTGVRLPTPAAAKGDTTLTGLMASQTSRGENAAFTATIANQERAANEALKEARKKLAADPRNIEAEMELQVAKANAENARRDAEFVRQQAELTRKLSNIDDRIQVLTNEAVGTEAGKADIGNRVSNLLSAKEAVIKGELSPKYDELLKDAKKQGIELSSEQVAAMWSYVKSSRAEDVFAKFPELYRNINKLFAPTKAPISSKFAEKYPNLVKSQEGTFKPAGVDDIDSLKRAINKALADTADKDQQRLLLELKRQFDGAVNSLPEDFVTKYRGLDRQYAERLGIPFSEQGVVSIDRAKFVENTVPMLTTKPTAIRQVLAATDNSPEALKIIEDAFLMKLSNTRSIVNPNTGELNPPQLNAFLQQNKEAIAEVPGLRERLVAASRDVAQLKEVRADLMNQQKNAQVEKFENVWTRAFNTSGGFQGYVRSSLKNPQQLSELMRLAGNDKTLQQGLKASVLDIGMGSSNRLEFFEQNAKTIDTLFGADYTKNVKALFEAADRLASFPLNVKINQAISQQTRVQQATGSKPEQVTAEARNPILGPFRMGANILSRFLQNRTTKSEDAEIQQFLSDPRAMKDAAEMVAELNKNTAKGLAKAQEIVGRMAKNWASAGVFGGLAAAGTGAAGLTEREPTRQFGE